jgi:hypothetical protein
MQLIRIIVFPVILNRLRMTLWSKRGSRQMEQQWDPPEHVCALMWKRQSSSIFLRGNVEVTAGIHDQDSGFCSTFYSLHRFLPVLTLTQVLVHIRHSCFHPHTLTQTVTITKNWCFMKPNPQTSAHSYKITT